MLRRLESYYNAKIVEMLAQDMLTFAEYMDRVLYGPKGYYATGQARSGREGDYFTAPDVGPVQEV